MSASSGFTALSWNEILLMDLLFRIFSWRLTHHVCCRWLEHSLFNWFLQILYIYYNVREHLSTLPCQQTLLEWLSMFWLDLRWQKYFFPKLRIGVTFMQNEYFFLSVIQRLQKRTIAPPRTFFGLLFGEYLASLGRWNTYLLGLLYCRTRGWCISSFPPLAQSGIVEHEQKSRKVFWLATESGRTFKTSIENNSGFTTVVFFAWPITNRTSSWYQAEGCENAYKSSL